MTRVNWQKYKIENFNTHNFTNTINHDALKETSPMKQPDMQPKESAEAEHDSRDIIFLQSDYIDDEISAPMNHEKTVIEGAPVTEAEIVAQTNEDILLETHEADKIEITAASPAVDRSKMQFSEPEFIPMAFTPRKVTAIY